MVGELVRQVVAYENTGARFQLHSKEFMKQYYGVYTSRLRSVAARLKQLAVDKFGAKYPVKTLSDLREEEQTQCILIGTLFKQQVLKPSILREIADESHVAPQPGTATCVDKSDKLILEDEQNRITLVGKVDVAKLVTGIVVAVLGYENADGEFIVDDMIFHSPSVVQRQLPLLATNSAAAASPLLVLISGIDQASTNDLGLSLELFRQWIFGNLCGPSGGQDEEAAAVCRVIVAGNSIRSTPHMRSRTVQTQAPATVDMLDAVKRVDTLLEGLCRAVPVDLMPGEFDPANHLLPQQPMHYCMFPEVTRHNTFTGVTNPYACTLADRDILGTSGQNIADICKFADLEWLAAMQATLDWGHLAPTCPDTLASYPFMDGDPFIMAPSYPHIYFAGNATAFATDLYRPLATTDAACRVVCVPSFAETRTVAVVDLATLDCYPMSFAVNNML